MNKYICDNCKKEFKDQIDCGEHAMKEKHYSFILKGTKFRLSVI
jgi:hypothetical protein